MPSTVNKLNNLLCNGADTTAILTIGAGEGAATLDSVEFELTGTAVTTDMIKEFRINFDGGEKYTGSGARNRQYNAYFGVFDDPKTLKIDFMNRDGQMAVDQYVSCIPLSLVTDMKIELDIASNAPTNFKMKALGDFRAETRNPNIKKRFRDLVPIQTVGENTLMIPTGANGGRLTRLFLHESTPGMITSLVLRNRNFLAREVSRTQIENDQRRNGKAPQTGLLVVDFVVEGHYSMFTNTAAMPELQLVIQSSATGTIDVVKEYIDPIARL